jgi:hypothetical protein
LLPARRPVAQLLQHASHGATINPSCRPATCFLLPATAAERRASLCAHLMHLARSCSRILQRPRLMSSRPALVGGNGARPTNPCPISARPLLPPSFHFGRWIQGVVAAQMNASTHQHPRLLSRALRAHQLHQLIASSCCNKIIPQLADEVCVLAVAAPYKVAPLLC